METVFIILFGISVVVICVLIGAVVRLSRERADNRIRNEEKVKALEREEERLRRNIGSLDAQEKKMRAEVQARQQELTQAEVQVLSAKTHFNDWRQAAQETQLEVSALQEKLNEMRNTGEADVRRALELRGADLEREIGERKAKAEEVLTAELKAQRSAAEAELVKRLGELTKEVEARQKECDALGHEKAELERLANECRELNLRIAAEHAEALKRLSLENGEGGHIEIGADDMRDSEDIRRICRGMRCENAILKATYDVYVKPQVERLVRDSGVAGVSGIYRIWKKDGEKELSYIGQAVDVGDRWKTHAKRAWGVDDTGRIVLYQAMSGNLSDWRWELVEATPQGLGGKELGDWLSEREKYWGGFYAVKELGLNKRLG